jgi:hypothetical protein
LAISFPPLVSVQTGVSEREGNERDVRISLVPGLETTKSATADQSVESYA